MKVCVYCLPYSLRLDSVVMPLILPDCLKEFVSCLLPPHTFRLNYTINKLNGADTGIKRERRNVVSQRMYEDGHVVAKIHLLSYVNLFVVVVRRIVETTRRINTILANLYVVGSADRYLPPFFPNGHRGVSVLHLIYTYKTVLRG